MNDDELAELAIWWWDLTEDERIAKRSEFMEEYYNNPEFHDQVNELLEQNPERL